MKLKYAFLLTALLPFSALAQEPQDGNDLKASEGQKNSAKKEVIGDSLKKFRADFTNLSTEEQKQYATLLQEASNKFRQKRIFESLELLHQIEKILEGGPNVINLFGANYVEFRDFEKARSYFRKALEGQPESTSIIFNLAEIEFVMKNWQAAVDQIDILLGKLPKNAEQMRQLVLFKKMLCLIKLEKLDEAEKLVGIYKELDDSPYYYYAKAAWHFHKDESLEADRELARARRIFRQPHLIAPWDDTLIEFGYLQSFFGNLETEAAK